MKTSVKPPTPTSAKESFKPEHTNTTRKKCRFENRGKCKNGRSCQFYHPRRTCKFFSQSNTCQKGEKNVNSDIQGEYVQFKTSQSSEICKTQSTQSKRHIIEVSNLQDNKKVIIVMLGPYLVWLYFQDNQSSEILKKGSTWSKAHDIGLHSLWDNSRAKP